MALQTISYTTLDRWVELEQTLGLDIHLLSSHEPRNIDYEPQDGVFIKEEPMKCTRMYGE
jgi:hypothetical protein